MQLTYVNTLGLEPDYEAILTILRSDSAEGAVRFSWNRGSTRRWKHYERVVSARERRLARSFYFATGSDAIDTTSSPAIGAIAAVLKANPSWRVTIERHTDSIGAKEVNQELSERRAARVVTVLREEHGIAAARLGAKGKGETELAGDNGTAQGRAASRRVALVRDCAGGKG